MGPRRPSCLARCCCQPNPTPLYHASLYIKALFICFSLPLWACRAGVIAPHFLVLGWFGEANNWGSNPSSPFISSETSLGLHVPDREMSMVSVTREVFLAGQGQGAWEPSVLSGERKQVQAKRLSAWVRWAPSAALPIAPSQPPVPWPQRMQAVVPVRSQVWAPGN